MARSGADVGSLNGLWNYVNYLGAKAVISHKLAFGPNNLPQLPFEAFSDVRMMHSSCNNRSLGGQLPPLGRLEPAAPWRRPGEEVDIMHCQTAQTRVSGNGRETVSVLHVFKAADMNQFQMQGRGPASAASCQQEREQQPPAASFKGSHQD